MGELVARIRLKAFGFTVALFVAVVFSVVGCARYDLFESYKEEAVKRYEESKSLPVASNEAAGDGSDETYIELGWMRPSQQISYDSLGDKLGIDGREIASLNWDDVDNEVPPGRLVLIPLSNSHILENVSDEDLLKVRATVHDSMEDSYLYRSDNSDDMAGDPDTQYVLKSVSEIAKNSSEVSAKQLGENFARLVGRHVADAAVGYARQTPWINTLEVEYKLPIGSDVATVSADALIALHELDEDGRFVFTQVGGRYKKDRFMGNLGIGYRQLSQDESWMWGGNAFLDYDFMGEHARAGLGAEIKTSLLDFYSNYYLPVTPWKKAYGNHYLEERAARGFDAGLVGRLPFLQSVDWNAKYFKWYGNRVDVYGDNKYLSDPDGVEIGATWTPWKAFKLGVAHSRVIGSSLQETRVEGTFSASFEELGSLFDSTKASEGPAIKERIGQLVKRQNEIVFERRVSAEGEAAGIVITKFQRN